MCILWREAIPQERLDFYQTLLVHKILFYFPIKHFSNTSWNFPRRTGPWLTTECYQHSFYNWEKYLNHQRETSSNILCVCVDTILIGCCVISWPGSPPIRAEITVDWRTSHLQSRGGRAGDNMWPQPEGCQAQCTEARWPPLPPLALLLWSPWGMRRWGKPLSSTDSAQTLLTRWVCWSDK